MQMDKQRKLYAYIDIAIKNMDWILLSLATNVRDAILNEIQLCFTNTLDSSDQVTLCSPYHIQVLHQADNLDACFQYVNFIDDAIYQLQNPYIHQRLFLGIGIYLMKEQDDQTFGFANAQFARMNDLDAQKLDTHIALHEPSMRLACITRRHHEQAMRIAYAQDAFDFVLQPKIPLHDDLAFRAEALLRCPILSSVISCFDMIQLAEHNGMIRDLDLLIFKKVLAFQFTRWKQGVTLFPISVNISRIHMENPLFFQTYLELFHSFDLPTTCIEFELTESAWDYDPSAFYHLVEQIHTAGFRVAMDDFGCGASSLSALKDLQMDTLKFDRQFFLHSNKRSSIILASLIDMAKKLDMEIVAEGVETKQQVSELKAWGCDYIQAYLYAKPMTQAAISELFEKWQDKKHSLFS